MQLIQSFPVRLSPRLKSSQDDLQSMISYWRCHYTKQAPEDIEFCERYSDLLFFSSRSVWLLPKLLKRSKMQLIQSFPVRLSPRLKSSQDDLQSMISYYKASPRRCHYTKQAPEDIEFCERYSDLSLTARNQLADDALVFMAQGIPI
ncbi:hypothetical protein QE152_g40733 [Popillia japonica]|uniref:Uncharacterized protein n=1 Tax=Popillia japonica TaxID=7064 RepID=A0AAW1HFK7_POPJA